MTSPKSAAPSAPITPASNFANEMRIRAIQYRRLSLVALPQERPA
jgi:hypothetical protein